MTRQVFDALLKAEMDRIGHPVPLSRKDRELVKSVWRWTQAKNPTIQEVQDEIRTTLSQAALHADIRGNRRGGGFMRVTKNYDGDGS